MSINWSDFYLPNLAFVSSKPQLSGNLKTSPQDFVVDEVLGFELSGAGDHLCALIEKRYLNTRDIVECLSKHFGIPSKAIGYCGLKDKYALTRQWFSIDLSVSRFSEEHLVRFDSGAECFHKTLSNAPEQASFKVLKASLNSKKLRLGSHLANRFELTIRNVAFTNPASTQQNSISQELDLRLSAIESCGFPNYFGEQRFGNRYGNLVQLEAYSASLVENASYKLKRNKRSMMISSLRSIVFNQYLSMRLQMNNWNQYLQGDKLNLRGSHSLFEIENDSLEQEQVKLRLDEGDIYISGPLVGNEFTDASGSAPAENEGLSESLELEARAYEAFSVFQNILDLNQVKGSRRALACHPDNLSWSFDDETFVLKVDLPSGVYATSLLREIMILNQAH